MIYPGTDSGFSMGDPSDLEQRKKQLIQKLLATGARNQSGLSGLHALPLFGGRGRGSSDLPNAALPSITFNPFLAMAAGRPNETFQAPSGVTQAALAQAQAGLRGPIGGPAPQQIQGTQPDPTQAAASAFLGANNANPGVDGPAAAAPAPPVAGSYDPNQAWGLNAASGVRHLAGNGQATPQPIPLPQGWIPRLGSLVAM